MTPALPGSWTYEVEGGDCGVNRTAMAKTYEISRKLGNGEFLYVASRSRREEADLLVQWLRTAHFKRSAISKISNSADPNSQS
jgi:reverse gyrase